MIPALASLCKVRAGMRAQTTTLSHARLSVWKSGSLRTQTRTLHTMIEKIVLHISIAKVMKMITYK